MTRYVRRVRELRRVIPHTPTTTEGSGADSAAREGEHEDFLLVALDIKTPFVANSAQALLTKIQRLLGARDHHVHGAFCSRRRLRGGQ